MSFKCYSCGKKHEGLPDIGAEYPDPYFDVPENERVNRVIVTSDLCSIDDEEFFIRGVIEIHVHGQDARFGLGVWVSLKKENFQCYVDNFDTDEIGPFFGWLSNRLECYADDTFSLKTMTHFRGGKTRPFIEVEPTDHPLAVDQREGISIERAWELVHHYM
ncbi:MAG: DUF2199 domain-containing protein [Acidobacteria bacterium]|nr:DUF2199 domain-containing protein [Acidobacteriota bacterium]